MKKKGLAGLGVALLFLSNGVSAEVPNTPFSHDYDIGTLGSSHYVKNTTVPQNILEDSYTFDLASPSHVYGWLWNLIPEMGTIDIGIISTLYAMGYLR
jgi:hypothetical protein